MRVLIRAALILALPFLLSACAGLVTALAVTASLSELAKNECNVSLGAAVQGQRPDCLPPIPRTASRWH